MFQYLAQEWDIRDWPIIIQYGGIQGGLLKRGLKTASFRPAGIVPCCKEALTARLHPLSQSPAGHFDEPGRTRI